MDSTEEALPVAGENWAGFGKWSSLCILQIPVLRQESGPRIPRAGRTGGPTDVLQPWSGLVQDQACSVCRWKAIGLPGEGWTNCGLWVHSSPLPVFRNKSFSEMKPCPFIYGLSKALSVLQTQSWVVATGTVWLTKPKIIIIWLFIGKRGQLLFQVSGAGDMRRKVTSSS